MSKGILITVVGTIISVGAIAAWFFGAHMPGAEWILFVAFIGACGLLDSIRNQVLGTIAGLVITVSAGAAWFFGQGLPNAGWVGCIALLAALGTFQALNSSVSENTSSPKKKKDK